MNLLFIKRQRGEVQPVVVKRVSDDEYISIQADGKPKLSMPKFSKTKEGENTRISISARDTKELNRISRELKEKHPNFDPENLKKNTTMKEENLGRIHIQGIIGGKELLKSIAKIAINFFIYKDGDRSQIADLLEYLNDQDDKINLNIASFHYPSVEIYKPNGFEVSHLILLVGDPIEKVLYTYIGKH